MTLALSEKENVEMVLARLVSDEPVLETLFPRGGRESVACIVSEPSPSADRKSDSIPPPRWACCGCRCEPLAYKVASCGATVGCSE